MTKCKILNVFELTWGTVVVLDFFNPTHFKLGDKLRNSNDHLWVITGISKGKPVDQTYENLSSTIHVWDCTIKPVNHVDLPKIGEELILIKE